MTLLTMPNVLGSEPEALDSVFYLVAEASQSQGVILDMSSVTFVHPYGAAVLLESCRYLAQLTRQLVCLTSVRSEVHAYLRRIDFFELGQEFVYTTDAFSCENDLGRRPASTSVLELVGVSTYPDVYLVTDRARRILSVWLSEQSGDVDKIVTLLSEACSNVVEHSGDWGLVTIQKYEHREHGRYVEVRLAITDLGKGIRRSLADVYPGFTDTCSGYIEKALGGLSSKSTGRGGQGLVGIQRIVAASGGSLYLRSETGGVLVGANGRHLIQDNLSHFPGTQVAITFRSNYR